MRPAKRSKKPAARSRDSQAAATEDPNVSMVRELARLVEEHTLSELVLETESLSLTLRRGPVSTYAQAPVHEFGGLHAPAAAPGAATALPAQPTVDGRPTAEEQSGHLITSPFVGTFYRSPNPDSPFYVEVGDHVARGQVLCIVEAMKLMNEIEADLAGTVAACLVENNGPVEYGQPLFRITPD
jgi:acetyl-CoA carboxylase biotin carboxyl carrier protein